MSLLPDDLQQFKSQEFWESFFKSRRNKPFEWYCDYQAIKPLVLNHCINKTTLIPGCGNSDLSAQLYDDGAENIINLDFSKLVIREMMTKNLRQRPKMKWLVMDITQMKFTDKTFDVVLDKGALDALMGDSEEESNESADNYLREPTSSKNIPLDILLDKFQMGFRLKVQEIEIQKTARVSEVCPFLFTAEALGDSSNQRPLVDLQISKDTLAQNAPQIQDIAEVIERDNSIRQSPTDPRSADYDKIYPGRRLVLDSIKCPYSKTLKKKLVFKAIVLDNEDPRFSAQCAVFIIPTHQENAWLYSSIEGQWTVAKQCKSARVILIAIQGHDSSYTLENEALSPAILHLIPLSVRYTPKATPFVTTSDEQDIQCDRAVYHSTISGDVVVRDCIEGNRILRRMIFRENESLIQTEVPLLLAPNIPSTLKDGELPGVDCLAPDFSTLSAKYQQVIANGLAPLASVPDKQLKILVIGLGGGALPAYLHSHVSQNIYVVELDPVTVDIAKKWFGFPDQIPIAISDGVHFVLDQSRKGESADVVILDAGGRDDSTGMSCPPAAFTSLQFLRSVHSYLTPDGLLLSNFVSRSIPAYFTALNTLQSIFPYTKEIKLDGEVNRVVFASKSEIISKIAVRID